MVSLRATIRQQNPWSQEQIAISRGRVAPTRQQVQVLGEPRAVVKQDECRSSNQDEMLRQGGKQRDRGLFHNNKDMNLILAEVPLQISGDSLLIPCPSWLDPAPDPSASSVKPLRFAPMNAHPAGLTARTDRRLPPPRRAFSLVETEYLPT